MEGRGGVGVGGGGGGGCGVGDIGFCIRNKEREEEEVIESCRSVIIIHVLMQRSSHVAQQ